MRALAEFIMRGRTQAAVVALLGSWFPLISPATVALVCLRRGPLDGLQVLLWAVLPALVALVARQMDPLMPLVTIGGLIAVLIAALLLRNSMSWPRALMALVALSTLVALLLKVIVSDPAHQLLLSLGAEGSEGVGSDTFADAHAIAIVAFVLAFNGLLSLLLARWWQALLYNPDGFQAEFHQLRLAMPQAAACMAASAYCLSQGGDYYIWAGLFSLPLMLIGVAIVHCAVSVLKLGGQWLVLFYVVLIFFSAFLLALLVIVAFLDVWIDFRRRLKSSE